MSALFIYQQKNGKISCVEVILNAGADVNWKDNFSNTALTNLARINDSNGVAAINILLKLNAETEIQDYYGETAFEKALRCGILENAKTLLKHNAQLAENGTRMLTHGIQHNNFLAADLLIKAGAAIDPNHTELNDEQLCIYAILIDDRDLFDKKHPNLTENQSRGYYEEPLFYALWKDNKPILDRLKNEGANVNMVCSDGYSLLMPFARYSELEAVIDNPICAGVELDMQDVFGGTALMYASLYNCKLAAGKLIRAGANLNLTDTNLMTPLNSACVQGNEFIAQLLIENSAELDQLDQWDKSALLSATENGNPRCIKRLLAANASMQGLEEQHKIKLENALGKQKRAITSRLKLFGLSSDKNSTPTFCVADNKKSSNNSRIKSGI